MGVQEESLLCVCYVNIDKRMQLSWCVGGSPNSRGIADWASSPRASGHSLECQAATPQWERPAVEGEGELGGRMEPVRRGRAMSVFKAFGKDASGVNSTDLPIVSPV